MQNRAALTQTNRVGRHRGARSMSHHYANLANMSSANGQKITDNNAVFSKTQLDNKGRAINKENNKNQHGQQTFSDQNLFDDLS